MRTWSLWMVSYSWKSLNVAWYDWCCCVVVVEYVLNTEAHPLPVFMPNHPLADFWSIICASSASPSNSRDLFANCCRIWNFSVNKRFMWSSMSCDMRENCHRGHWYFIWKKPSVFSKIPRCIFSGPSFWLYFLWHDKLEGYILRSSI